MPFKTESRKVPFQKTINIQCTVYSVQYTRLRFSLDIHWPVHLLQTCQLPYRKHFSNEHAQLTDELIAMEKEYS